MYRNFLSRHFNEEELQIIDWAVELIRSGDLIKVDMAFGGLNSIGLLRRLLDVLSDYCNEVTFCFERNHHRSKLPPVLGKYVLTIYENESPILLTLEKMKLTTQEKGVLFYSFESGFGERFKSYLGLEDLGGEYENIPIPIFAKELRIYTNEPINKISLRNYELFNTPVSKCYIELWGSIPIKLPYLNINSELIFKLHDDNFHMKSVFDNLLLYPNLKKIIINTNFFEKTSIQNMVAHFHLPNNILEFELYENMESVLSEFETAKKFIGELLDSNLVTIKLTFRDWVKLSDSTLSLLNNYNFSFEDDGWAKKYSLHRNI